MLFLALAAANSPHEELIPNESQQIRVKYGHTNYYKVVIPTSVEDNSDLVISAIPFQNISAFSDPDIFISRHVMHPS